MQKINFQNLPSTATPINATNLNAIQTNVEDVFNGNVAMGNIQVTSLSTNEGIHTDLIQNGDANNYLSKTVFIPIFNHNSSFSNVPVIEPNGDDVGYLNVYSWGGNADWTIQEYIIDKSTKTYKYIRRKTPQGWSTWERIYNEKILYDGNTNTDINIGENLLNYEYIEIFYQDEVGRITGSLKTKPIAGNISTGGGLLCLSLNETENGFIVFKTATWYIDSTWLRKTNEAFTQVFHNGSIAGNNNTGWLWIKKVVGYN